MLLTLLAAAAVQTAPAPDPRASFFAAARAGRVDVIEALLDAGAPINARDDRGYTGLILAAYNGRAELARRLIDRGAEVCAGDARGNTALMGAAFKGDDAMARLLVETRACPVDQANAQGQTALMMASLFGRVAQVRMLLAAGAEPGKADLAGATAASLARAQGATEVATLLQAATSPAGRR